MSSSTSVSFLMCAQLISMRSKLRISFIPSEILALLWSVGVGGGGGVHCNTLGQGCAMWDYDVSSV